ncbi:MAG TPA: kelch repeat-containing protein [Planctomycetota bacterium]|nr:kelch repeat-containing protein [Planctomycetota bacterium]
MSLSRRGRVALLALVALSACSQKKTLVPYVVPVTPTTVVTGNTPIFYSVFAPEGEAVRASFQVSTNDGATYVDATPYQGPAAPIVGASPFGQPQVFYWNSLADLGPGVFQRVLIRGTGFAAGETGRQSVTLPFLANESGSFTPTQNTGFARSEVFSAPNPDDSVVIAGGSSGGQPASLVEVYDPVFEQVTAVSSLSVARTNMAGALLSNGVVLMAGGADVTSAALGAADIFTRSTNVSAPVTGGLVVPRFDAAVAAVGSGMAVVVGGVGPGGALVPTIELYLPALGPQGGFAAVATSTLAAVRLPTATALRDGTVLVVGGSDASGNAVASAFVFDPVALTVTPVPGSVTARVGHRATLLSTGNVLVAGGLGQLGSFQTTLASSDVYDATQKTFTRTAIMARARAFQGQDLAGGRVVAVGGLGTAGDVATTGEAYDQDANTWTLLPFPPVSPRPDATVVQSGPGRALVAGGGAPPELYHPLDGFLNPVVLPPGLPPPPPPNQNPGNFPPQFPVPLATISESWIAIRATARPRAFHTGTLLTTGDVLLVGGTTGITSATASVELYGAQLDQVTTRAPLLTARAHHAATLLPTGTIVVSGGVDENGNVLGSLELYTLQTDTWTQSRATLAFPRYDHHAILLGNGLVLIEGGRDKNGAPIAACELYGSLPDTVTETGSLNVARADDDVSVILNGNVFVSGGRDANGNPVLTEEVYELFAGQFVPGGSLQEGRSGLVLSRSANEFQLIATGGDFPGGTRDDFEGIDESTGLPEPVPGGVVPLDSPRAFHQAIPYVDANVLLCGGEANGFPLDTSSLYVPSVPVFVPIFPTATAASVRPTKIPRMNVQRFGHTAVQLHDGRVLVAGGVDARGVVVAGVETFNR